MLTPLIVTVIVAPLWSAGVWLLCQTVYGSIPQSSKVQLLFRTVLVREAPTNGHDAQASCGPLIHITARCGCLTRL
jgi:hypothetical protein